MTATVSEQLSVTLQSPGPLLFKPDVGPDGVAVLFVSDVSAATVFAAELPPEASTAAGNGVQVDQLGVKLAALLGVETRTTWSSGAWRCILSRTPCICRSPVGVEPTPGRRWSGRIRPAS